MAISCRSFEYCLHADWTLLPFRLVCFLIGPIRLTLLHSYLICNWDCKFNKGNTDSCLTTMATGCFNQLVLDLKSLFLSFLNLSPIIEVILWTLVGTWGQDRQRGTVSGILHWLVNEAYSSLSVKWRRVWLRSLQCHDAHKSGVREQVFKNSEL